jgi:hypothetical protein
LKEASAGSATETKALQNFKAELEAELKDCRKKQADQANFHPAQPPCLRPTEYHHPVFACTWLDWRALCGRLPRKRRRAIALRVQALDLEEATTAVKALHAVICTHGPTGPQGGIGGILPQR